MTFNSYKYDVEKY